MEQGEATEQGNQSRLGGVRRQGKAIGQQGNKAAMIWGGKATRQRKEAEPRGGVYVVRNLPKEHSIGQHG